MYCNTFFCIGLLIAYTTFLIKFNDNRYQKKRKKNGNRNRKTSNK